MWSTVEPVSSVDESIVGVFCTNGLLRISSQQTITNVPTIHGILQNNRLIIAVDSTVILFLDEKRCNETVFLDVEHSVETFAVSSSGDITICGLSNGTMIGLHVTGVMLFELPIEATDRRTAGPSFVGIVEVGNGQFLVQTTCGSMYLVTVDETKIVHNIDTITRDELRGTVKCERLVGKHFQHRIVCFIACPHYWLGKKSSVPQIAAASNDAIYFYRDKDVEQVSLKAEYNGVRKMFNLMNCIFALTNSGQLFEICPLTKLMSELPCSFRIDDLVTLQTSGDVIEMLITTKADATGKKLMKIVTFPSMEVKHEMEMSEHTWLLQQPKNSANIYYIAGRTHNEPVVQEFELKILSETDPSLRLLKLLTIGRLDEAEVFANQFELDVQLVHKARAKLLLDELSAAGNDETAFNKLMQVLGAVDDTEYLTSIRSANIDDRSMKKRFLQFLLSKVSATGTAEMESVIDMNERLLRIETLQLIDPFEIDQDWQQFVYHDNLPQLCTELFVKDMDAACLIWSRHFASILPQLDDAKVTALLRAIPKETSPLHVIQWLLHFVGPILHHLPQLMHQLVQLIVGRTKSFQKLQGWPLIGLTFMEDAIKILQEVQFPLIDLRLEYDSNMGELQRLADALRDLVTLKQQFNLLASLDCYMQEDMESTAFRLLQITPLNLLARIVTEFLYKFFIGQEEKLFLQIERYIQFLVANQYNSFWDQRCITLVELLYDEKQQLEMVLTILRAAPVPWSPTVSALLKYAASEHPIADMILLEQNHQAIKCLKIKYGWSLKAPSDTRLLVQRVLKMHLPEMLGDIRAIVKATPALAFTTDLSVLTKLAEYGDILTAAEYLDGLEKDRKAQCCRGTVSMMIRMLDGRKLPKDLETAYLEALQMLKHRAEPLQQKSIVQIVNIVQLRNEFGLSVTCESVNDRSQRSKLLHAGIRFVLGKIRSDREQFIDILLGATRRLASLLRYSLLECLHEVMLLLDNVHMSCLLAAQLTKIADLRAPEAFEQVHRIVSLLLAQQMLLLRRVDGLTGWLEDPLTFPICRELLYQAVGGSPDQMATRLELLRWIQIGVRYYPTDIECETRRRTVVPEPVFDAIYERLSQEGESQNGPKLANGTNGDLPAKGGPKRESLSAFDVVNDDFDQVTVPRNRHMPDQETIVKCVGLAIQLLLCHVCNGEQQRTFAHVLQRIGTVDEMVVSTELQATLDHLIRGRQYPPVVNIVHLLMSYRASIGLLIPANYAENVYRKSIKYMLSQKEPNYSGAIMTLFTCENRDGCLEYLRSVLTNDSQRISLHTLLEFYYFTIGQEAKAVDERSQRLRYTLFHELCKLDPSLKTKKAFVFQSQADLMKEIKHKLIGVELLRKMSDAFSWDYQQMLVSQIVTFFDQQELSFTVRMDEFGHEHVLVHDTAEAMLAQLHPYLTDIENAVLLCTKLTKHMEQANNYFYEQFFAIFDILAQFSEPTDEIDQWRSILAYMQQKLTGRRRHRPCQAEVEAWMRVHPDGDMLPEIAKFRYPFTLIIRQPLKTLLKDDITIENYRKLLVLVYLKAKLDGLDTSEMNDYFCRSTVVNSINEYKIQHKERSQQSDWLRQTKNKGFLQAILHIVDSVLDLSSKLHILYYIACNALDGDDQVKAAHKCYKFARKHEHKLADIPEAKDKMEKIFRKYPVLRTQQLLQQNGVLDEKLYQLVKSPQELITALYSDSCLQKVNVNELAAVIGQLQDLDVEAIQVALLQKWLSMFGGSNVSENSDGMMEETLYEDHNISDTSQDDETSVHECVSRAYYILSSWERSKSVEFLVAQLNSSVDTSTGSSEISKQLQIYQCFSKLVDDKCTSYQEFFTQNRYVALKCIHLLKSIGMHHLSIGKFEAADKMALLKMLWQSHATNPKGLEVLSLICIGYGIYAPQVWNGILKQMARLGLVANLRALIEVVSAQRQLFGLDGYRMAWELLIKEPFRSATREQSLAEDAMLARSLVMMQKCPISFRLNLIEVADACVNVNRVSMAAVLVGFARDDQKEALKMLIANNTVPNLLEQIRELEEFGLVTALTKSVCRELSLHETPPASKRWR